MASQKTPVRHMPTKINVPICALHLGLAGPRARSASVGITGFASACCPMSLFDQVSARGLVPCPFGKPEHDQFDTALNRLFAFWGYFPPMRDRDVLVSPEDA